MTDQEAKDRALLTVLRWDCIPKNRPHPVETCPCKICRRMRASAPGNGFRNFWCRFSNFVMAGSLFGMIASASKHQAIATGICFMIYVITYATLIWRDTR